MAEADVVRSSSVPRTQMSLARDLEKIGVRPGGVLIVHSSLKAVGWVAGGPVAVVKAFCSAVTAQGTLVMPAQSQDLTDPSGWTDPPVPVEWHDEIRRSMPAFCARQTPTWNMGRVAELFRTWPNVVRSNHPACSFAAWGASASEITLEQPLSDPFGEASPLARLYDLQADILLLGVTFESCTALHLAERRVWPNQTVVREGSPMMVNGVRAWVEYQAPRLRLDLFKEVGKHVMNTGLVKSAQIGSATSHFMPMRGVVDAIAEVWRSGDHQG